MLPAGDEKAAHGQGHGRAHAEYQSESHGLRVKRSRNQEQALHLPPANCPRGKSLHLGRRAPLTILSVRSSSNSWSLVPNASARIPSSFRAIQGGSSLLSEVLSRILRLLLSAEADAASPPR